MVVWKMCYSNKMSTKLGVRQLSNLTCKQIFLFVLLFQVICVFVLFGKRKPNFGSCELGCSSVIPWINTRENKTILPWNSTNRIETSAFGLGHQPFLQNGCDISECVVWGHGTATKCHTNDELKYKFVF